jgi:peptide/nickel transport system substrate-binding protein
MWPDYTRSRAHRLKQRRTVCICAPVALCGIMRPMNTQRPVAGHVRWQIIIVAAGVALLATLLIYVALTFTTQLSPAQGGAYIEGMVGQPRAINPLLCQFNDVDRDLCSLIFNGLLRLDSHGLPQPDLAARPAEISPDGLLYTVTLRTDVRWHDGQPFTADDVLFTINLLKDPNFPGLEDLAELWRTVEISRVSPYKLSFKLQEPFAPFQDYLTLGIAPAHALRNIPAADLPSADFNLRPIGTGPFKVEDVQVSRGQVDHIRLAVNPAYFGSQPYLDKIEFKFFADDLSVFNAYRAGQVQGIARVPYTELARLRQYPRLSVFSAPVAGYSVIFMNMVSPDVPFFQEKEIRQALSYALDRQKLIDQTLGGNGIAIRSPVLPDTWAFDSTLPAAQPDADKARALLETAGWKIGQTNAESNAVAPGEIAGAAGVQVVIPPGVRSKEGRILGFTLLTSNDPAHAAMAQAIAEQWSAIGVTVTVKPVPMLVTNYLAPRSFEAVLIDLSMAGDPDPYPFWHETQAASGQNYGGYKNRDMSEILEQARRTSDRNERAQLYRRFQQMFMDEMPAILLHQPVYTFAADERVGGVQIGPLEYPSDRFRTVADWYIVMRRMIVSSR